MKKQLDIKLDSSKLYGFKLTSDTKIISKPVIEPKIGGKNPDALSPGKPITD